MQRVDLSYGIYVHFFGLLAIPVGYYYGWFDTFMEKRNIDMKTSDSLYVSEDTTRNVEYSGLNIFTGLYALCITCVLMYVVFHKQRRLQRLYIRKYNVLFPLNLVSELLILVSMTLARQGKIDYVVPHMDLAPIYSSISYDASFILRFFLLSFMKYWKRYSKYRLVLFMTMIVVQGILMLSLTQTIGINIVEYLVRFSSKENFITEHFCGVSNLNPYSESAVPAVDQGTFQALETHNYKIESENNRPFYRLYSSYRMMVTGASGKNLPLLNSQIPISLGEDLRLHCNFSQKHSNYSTEFNLYWMIGTKILTNSDRLFIDTKYFFNENNKHTFSTLAIDSVIEEDFKTYMCVQRGWKEIGNRVSFQYTEFSSLIQLESIIIGVFSVSKRPPEKIIIHIPMGNSIYLEWCRLNINSEMESVSHNHTVDGHPITEKRHKDRGLCSALPVFYHMIAYLAGWINIPYVQTADSPSYVFRPSDSCLSFALLTCASSDIYGIHRISVLRDYCNKTSNSTVIEEVKHFQEVFVLPETPYYLFQSENSQNTSNIPRILDDENLRYIDRFHILVLWLRFTAEWTIFVFLVLGILYLIVLICLQYQKYIAFPLRNYILEGQFYVKNAEYKYDVVVFYSEEDRDYIENVVKSLVQMEVRVLCYHRDTDHRGGVTFSEIYSDIYKESENILIYMSTSFVNDDECISFQLETTMNIVRENLRCAHKVLLIHVDECSVPMRVRCLMPSIEVHDWLHSVDNATRIRNLKKWLDSSRKCSGNCGAKGQVGNVPTLIFN